MQQKLRLSKGEMDLIAHAKHSELMKEFRDAGNRIRSLARDGAESLELKKEGGALTKAEGERLQLLEALAGMIEVPSFDNYNYARVVFGPNPKMHGERGHYGASRLRLTGRDIAATAYVDGDGLVMVGEFRSLRFSDRYQHILLATSRNIFRIEISADGTVREAKVKSSEPSRLSQIVDGLEAPRYQDALDWGRRSVDSSGFNAALAGFQNGSDAEKRQAIESILAMFSEGKSLAYCLAEAMQEPYARTNYPG